MNAAVRAWLLPGMLAAFCLLAMVPGGLGALRYERALLFAEPWRLVTGHLVHLGWAHLALNLAALATIWALLGERLRTGAWLAALGFSALAVSAGLWLGGAGLEWYVGLSGLLHALFVVGSIAGLRQAPVFHGLLLAGAAGKVAWEQLAGADLGTAALIGGTVVVDAHLYGVLAGLILAPLAWSAAQPATGR